MKTPIRKKKVDRIEKLIKKMTVVEERLVAIEKIVANNLMDEVTINPDQSRNHYSPMNPPISVDDIDYRKWAPENRRGIRT